METKKIDFTKALIDFDGREIIDNDVRNIYKKVQRKAVQTA